MARTGKKIEKMKAEAKAAEVKETEKLAVEAEADAEQAAAVAEESAAQTAEKAEKAVESSRKTAARKVAKTEVFVQAHGGEAGVDELVERAAAAFKAAHKRTKIEELKLYVNADERRAYYVVNGEGSADAYIEF